MNPHPRKAVGYAYPTSPNAVKLGFRHGCFTVKTGGNSEGDTGQAVKGFDTEAEAFAHADTLPGEWDRFSRSRPVAA